MIAHTNYNSLQYVMKNKKAYQTNILSPTLERERWYGECLYANVCKSSKDARITNFSRSSATLLFSFDINIVNVHSFAIVSKTAEPAEDLIMKLFTYYKHVDIVS